MTPGECPKCGAVIGPAIAAWRQIIRVILVFTLGFLLATWIDYRANKKMLSNFFQSRIEGNVVLPEKEKGGEGEKP